MYTYVKTYEVHTLTCTMYNVHVVLQCTGNKKEKKRIVFPSSCQKLLIAKIRLKKNPSPTLNIKHI